MQAQQQIVTRFSARETGGLIGSDKVEGTAVYRPTATGSEQLSADDRQTYRQVGYAVMSFGGFLGWAATTIPFRGRLVYNENLGGYEVGVSDEQLRGAPKFPPAIPGWWRTAEMRRRSTPITAQFPTGEGAFETKEACMSDIEEFPHPDYRNRRLRAVRTGSSPRHLRDAGARVDVASPDGEEIRGWDEKDWGQTVLST